ncbi:MAG TPA: hypothetical protein VKX17_07985 [Planctomycetota bacterium]|nr:hypothetical protein [Planctomycetota bacterium]
MNKESSKVLSASFGALRAHLRRRWYTIAFLLIFFLAVAACAYYQRANLFNSEPGSGAFDSKGILTGAGSILALIGASILALVLYQGVLLFLLIRTSQRIEEMAQLSIQDNPALTRWLALDLLSKTHAPSEDWTEMAGVYRGRPFRIERRDEDLIRMFKMCAQTESTLEFSAALRDDESPKRQSAGSIEYATSNKAFDEQCDWKSPTPDKAVTYFNKSGVIDALLRLATSPDGVVLQNGRISATLSSLDMQTERGSGKIVFGEKYAGNVAPFVLAARELVFLANVLESKDAAPLPLAKPAESKAPDSSPTMTGCAVLILALLGVATLWIGAAYFTARLIGLAGGMVCFFIPILIAAFFVFTRPTDESKISTHDEAEKVDWYDRLLSDPDDAMVVQKFSSREAK